MSTTYRDGERVYLGEAVMICNFDTRTGSQGECHYYMFPYENLQKPDALKMAGEALEDVMYWRLNVDKK